MVDGDIYTTITPDLRSRFIVGYSGSGDYNSIGNMGGTISNQLSTSQLPSHSHSVTVSTDGAHLHTVNVSSIDDHNHNGVNGNHFSRSDASHTRYIYSNENSSGDPYTSHSHTFSDVGYEGSGSAIENRPAYYTVAFIMKTHTDGPVTADGSSDLSNVVDAIIEIESGLDSVESGLQLWLNAADIDGSLNTTLADGASVSEWKDISGNENNASQTSASSRPTFDDTNTEVDFSGSQYLDIENSPNPTTAAGDYTIIVVTKRETDNSGNMGVVSASHSSPYTRDIRFSNNYIRGDHYGGSVESLTEVPLSQNTIAISDYSGSTPKQRLFINGMQESENVESILNNQDVTSGGQRVGATAFSGTSGLTEYLNGSIKEILVFDEVLADDARIYIKK